MNEFKIKMQENLNKQESPNCDCKDIGINNWGIWYDEKDWFYYCRECDYTFRDGEPKLNEEESDAEFEMCNECCKYSFNLNDEGRCRECESLRE